MKYIAPSLMVLVCSFSLALATDGPPPVKRLPVLEMFPNQGTAPNGSLVVSVQRDGRWTRAGELGFDQFPRTRELELTPFLAGCRKPVIRIAQEGGGTASIDSVQLGGEPARRLRGRDDKALLHQLGRVDHDLAPVTGQGIELQFRSGKAGTLLKLTARIDRQNPGGHPLLYPRTNVPGTQLPPLTFYTYTLDSAAPPTQGPNSPDFWHQMAQRQPLFKEISIPNSGHPSGYTIGWISNDEKNLRFILDFTPDNTCDDDQDFAKLLLKTDESTKEFKITSSDTRWGSVHFQSTPQASYDHKVYDFVIPRSELGAAGGSKTIELALSAYGTVAISPASPSLAYDPGSDRYLLVYGREVGVDNVDVFGQLVDRNGSLIGVEITVCAAPLDQGWPRVAADTANGRFLVVWSDERSENYDIYGRLIGADGMPIGSDFPVAATLPDQDMPCVAYDSVNRRFLVAWMEQNSIFGQLLNADGTSYPGPGTPFPIFPVQGFMTVFPSVAHDAQSGRYLAAFTVFGPMGIIPAGQFIDGSGAPYGVPFPFTTTMTMGIFTSVSNDSISHRFMVSWMILGATADIVGQIINSDGSLLFTESFPISTNPADQAFPMLDFDPVHQRFLCVWADDRNDPQYNLYGQFLNPDGQPQDSAVDTNFLIGNSFPGMDFPALAANTRCGNFLAAWSTGGAPAIGLAIVGGDCAFPPTVETLPVSAIAIISAHSGGRVTDDGGASVFERGVCWNTTGNPTIFDTRTSDGSGMGSFASTLTGLSPVTTYTVRAYASNSAGTGYGEVLTFQTKRYTVTFVAGSGGSLLGETIQYLDEGGTCSPVQALANPGYFLTGWTGTGGFTSKANPITVSNVNSDMTITASFARMGLQAIRGEDRAWLLRHIYAKIDLTVEGVQGSAAAKFVLSRRINGGSYQVLKEIPAAELQSGAYTYVDLTIENGKTYTYKLEAVNAAGEVLGTSNEVTI